MIEATNGTVDSDLNKLIRAFDQQYTAAEVRAIVKAREMPLRCVKQAYLEARTTELDAELVRLLKPYREAGVRAAKILGKHAPKELPSSHR